MLSAVLCIPEGVLTKAHLSACMWLILNGTGLVVITITSSQLRGCIVDDIISYEWSASLHIMHVYILFKCTPLINLGCNCPESNSSTFVV